RDWSSDVCSSDLRYRLTCLNLRNFRCGWMVKRAAWPPDSGRPSPLGRSDPVDLTCGPLEKRRLLVRRCAHGQPLEGIPEHPVAARAAIDREIALEHRAPGAEGF